MSGHSSRWDTAIGFPNTYQLNSDFTMQLSNNWGQEWESEISFAFCCNYSISTWSGRVFSVRDSTKLKRGSWEETNSLEWIWDFIIARVVSLAEVLARDMVWKKTCIRGEMTEARDEGSELRSLSSRPCTDQKTTGVGSPLSLRDRDTLHVLSA